MDVGMMGGILGGALGLAGGALGTYFSIRNTRGTRERGFMVRVAAVGWALIIAFLLSLHVTPEPYKWLLWVPYGIGLGLGIAWCNRRQGHIRAEEQRR